MERSFPPKTIALVANTTVTIQWSGPDISPRFNESIIKRPVAIRFSCSTTAGKAVNAGVRYNTLTKTYQVAERKTLFVIPAGGSAEITPASKPALGMLNEWITDLFLDLTAPVTGNVTVTLIIDDDPPPLTGDPGELIGLDAASVDSYLVVNAQSGGSIAVGVTNTLIYTVPAGKRYMIDYMGLRAAPTPSYPGLGFIAYLLNIGGTDVYVRLYTETEKWAMLDVFNLPFILLSGDTIREYANNGDTTTFEAIYTIFGREIF